MTLTLPPPPAVRTAALVLWGLAGLTVLGGVGTLGLLAAVVLLDPTLPGASTLALTLGVLGGGLTLAVAGLQVLLATSLPEGRPGPRVGASLVAVLWLATPAFPVGVGLLWSLWGDARALAWYERLATIAAQPAPGALGSAASGEASAPR